MRAFGILVVFITLIGMVSATDVSVEGHTFSLDMPDGWTVDNTDKMSVHDYLDGVGSYDYTGTYVGSVFSPHDGKSSISVAIVNVPPSEAGEDSVDNILKYLNGDMMTLSGDSSEKYIDFDGKKAYLVEAKVDYDAGSSASLLSMTVALDKSTYAYVYGYFKDNGKAWDAVKGMSIT